MTNRLDNNLNLKIHSENNFNYMPVQTKCGVLIENYLLKMQQTLDNALEEHPRTFAIRFDLRFPANTNSNSSTVISKFISSLKAQIKADLIKRKKITGRVHPCTLRYVWVKEQNQSQNWHYHVLILLNKDCYAYLGDIEKSEGNMAARIKKAFASAIGFEVPNIVGLVHFPANPIYSVDKNCSSFTKNRNNLFYRISYFAKASTKKYGDYNNSFGSSH